jgi:hypothetical protein
VPAPSSGSTQRTKSAARSFHGDAGVLDCIDLIRELAGRYELREVMYDPWRLG